MALFRMFAGTREFNPLVVVFQPWTWRRRFQFFRAFQAFKHALFFALLVVIGWTLRQRKESEPLQSDRCTTPTQIQSFG